MLSKSLFVESLRKILYQAYHLLKKVKSAEMSIVQHVHNIFNSVMFSRQKNKIKNMSDEQTDQQQIRVILNYYFCAWRTPGVRLLCAGCAPGLAQMAICVSA